jgi:hypothetical protein
MHATDALGTGIPTEVRSDRRTTKVSIGPPPPSEMNTQPHPMAIPQAQPTTWPEYVADLTGRAGASAVRQWMHEAKADAPGRPPSPSPPSVRLAVIAILALILSILAVVSVVAAVISHQMGSSAYETKQAEANQAFRETLATQSDAIAAQRDAFYLLIDVLCESNPKVCLVERKLQRDTVRP